MALRIAFILLAATGSLNLRAADDVGDTADTLAGHPSKTVSQADAAAAGEVSIGEPSSSSCITYGECPECRNRVVRNIRLREQLEDKVNTVFGDTSQEFPFSPRLIRQRNYGIQFPDESLLSGEFLNTSTWRERNTCDSPTPNACIIQAAGTDDESLFEVFELVLDAHGNGINIIRRKRANPPVPVLGDCEIEGEGPGFRRVKANPDEEPIDVVFADGDDDCGSPALAEASESTPGSPCDGWLCPLNLTSGAAATQPATVSESCSQPEPPLKAKVEHLLEAARHLAGAGYEDEAKLFRVEAEAIQSASTRLLTEKRQELDQLQREIAELEALTGQYAMIQIDCRIIELSLPSDCDTGAHLSVLQEPGIHILTGRPCSSGFVTASRLLTGDELAHALQAIEHHPCGVLRTIAEPVMLTTNGRPASLRNGGEFPILIPVSAAGSDAKVQTEWRDFGVTMQAVPFILGNGKVRLSLETEVSDRDFTNAVQLNGTSVPGLTTCRFRTDVEAQFGETVAIACNSTRPTDGERRSLLVLVTARQIEPPAERPAHD